MNELGRIEEVIGSVASIRGREYAERLKLAGGMFCTARSLVYMTEETEDRMLRIAILVMATNMEALMSVLQLDSKDVAAAVSAIEGDGKDLIRKLGPK